MYDDILVPADDSDGMDAVVDHTEALAGEHGGTVHGLYVVNTASLTDLGPDVSPEGLTEALEREGRTALDELEGQVTGVDAETELRVGSPSEEIIEYADDTED
ncbi:hypothetical protein BRC65_09365 [Halobacteriales archaeon QH_2_65_14]|nr:MAG: hypothetical protein BRC65_09365 [Halobacteriales archaeon QH_2_65_14]